MTESPRSSQDKIENVVITVEDYPTKEDLEKLRD